LIEFEEGASVNGVGDGVVFQIVERMADVQDVSCLEAVGGCVAREDDEGFGYGIGDVDLSTVLVFGYAVGSHEACCCDSAAKAFFSFVFAEINI
jgi:hypothetical protein